MPACFWTSNQPATCQWEKGGENIVNNNRQHETDSRSEGGFTTALGQNRQTESKARERGSTTSYVISAGKKKFHSAAQQVSARAIQSNQFISTSHFRRVATDCEILIFVSLLTQTSKTYSKCLNKWRLDFFKCSSYTIVWTGSVKDKPRVTFPLYRDTNLSVITHTPWPITQLKQESVCGRWSQAPGTDVPRTMISHPTERGRGVSKMVQLCHIRRHPP